MIGSAIIPGSLSHLLYVTDDQLNDNLPVFWILQHENKLFFAHNFSRFIEGFNVPIGISLDTRTYSKMG
jgi:hypothetical protein